MIFSICVFETFEFTTSYCTETDAFIQFVPVFTKPFYVAPSDSSVAVTELIFNGSDTINLVNIPEDAIKVELFRNGIQLDDMVIDGTEAIVQIGTPASYQAYIYNAVGEIPYLLVETPILTIVTATGGTVNEIDGFTVHTFTSYGNFVVEGGGLEVEYLVVGGGGGGGAGGSSAGGGAGGFIEGTFSSIGPGTYSIIIGSGGSGSTDASVQGGTGVNSTFNGIVGLGGGGGSSTTRDGLSGGSGGGGSRLFGTAGLATQTGSAHSGFGNDGGTGNAMGAAGGGAGGAGGDGGGNYNQDAPAVGGIGKSSSITGASTFYAAGGGGGGGGAITTPTVSASGIGGIGSSTDGTTAATDGAVNTGSGGGAGSHEAGAAGSGIVIIRYAV